MGKNLKGKEIGEGLRQRSDGRFEARFSSRDGKRISKYFETLNEAKHWLAEAKYDDEHCRISNPRNLNVETWFWYWLDEIKGDTIRYGTRQAYEWRFNSRIKPILGNMQLSDVKPLHCQQVINWAQEEGESSGSVRKLRIVMHSFFEAARDNDMIESNPVRSSVTYIKNPPDERRVLTEYEQEILLDAAKGNAFYPVFAFALQTGLRVGEIQGLKWEDISFSARAIHVNRSLDYRQDMKTFVENPPKSKTGVRVIPMTDEAMRILMEVKELDKTLPQVVPYTNLVFRNKEGKPSHRGNYNRTLKKLASDTGMETLSMHVLRHSFATRCIESGMRPKTLQKIMGHASLSLTMDLYVHVTTDALFDEMKKFELRAKNA